MNDQTKIRALLFDVGGVCLTNGWDENSREEAANIFSLDFRETEKLHEKVFEDFERGDLTLEDYIDTVYFNTKRDFSREDVLRFMKDQSKPYDSTLEIVAELKKEGRYRLATINNEAYALNKFRIEKFRLARYFDNFFSSSYLHMRKPEPRIFRTVLNIMALSPEACLFIDDREENIGAALNEGMQCIHLTKVSELGDLLKQYNIR